MRSDNTPVDNPASRKTHHDRIATALMVLTLILTLLSVGVFASLAGSPSRQLGSDAMPCEQYRPHHPLFPCRDVSK